MMADYFRTLARYNAWANRRLYDACRRLSKSEYHKERRAFFHSLHGTLHHILVGDRIWLSRITGTPSTIKALNEILYPDLASLSAARTAEDEGIIALLDALPEAGLARMVRYRLMSEPRSAQETSLHLVLGHMFNHQTHHRGQAHDQLTQTDQPPPSLDLGRYLGEAA
jgi:uncharacterized damage-inducible protein DinB